MALPAGAGTVAGSERNAGIGGVATPVVSTILLLACSDSIVRSIMQDALQYCGASSRSSLPG
jgi:hypothetical protein